MVRTIIIVDDKSDRIGIQAVISSQEDLTVVGMGNDGYEALRLVGGLCPDVAILKRNLPLIDGTDVAGMMKQRFPAIAFIIIFESPDETCITKAIQKEVAGYLLQTDALERIIDAIRTVYHYGLYLSPRITATVFRLLSDQGRKPLASMGILPLQWKIKDPFLNISRMEYAIMGALAQGLSNKEIAQKLKVTHGTVRNYISSIMQKTELRDRTQIALFAYAHKIRDM